MTKFLTTTIIALSTITLIASVFWYDAIQMLAELGAPSEISMFLVKKNTALGGVSLAVLIVTIIVAIAYRRKR